MESANIQANPLAIELYAFDDDIHARVPRAARITELTGSQAATLRITGLGPNQPYIVMAQQGAMSSSNRFLADAFGIIDLGQQSPRRDFARTYDGIDPVGYFWSMRTAGGVAEQQDNNLSIQVLRVVGGGTVTVTQQTFRRSDAPSSSVVERGGQYTLLQLQSGAQESRTRIIVVAMDLATTRQRMEYAHSLGWDALGLALCVEQTCSTIDVTAPQSALRRAIEGRPSATRAVLWSVGRAAEFADGLSASNVTEQIVENGSFFRLGRFAGNGAESLWTEHDVALPALLGLSSDGMQHETMSDGRIGIREGAAIESAVERASSESLDIAFLPARASRTLFVAGADNAALPSCRLYDFARSRMPAGSLVRNFCFDGAGANLTAPIQPTTLMLAERVVGRPEMRILGGEARSIFYAQVRARHAIVEFLANGTP